MVGRRIAQSLQPTSLSLTPPFFLGKQSDDDMYDSDL